MGMEITRHGNTSKNNKGRNWCLKIWTDAAIHWVWVWNIAYNSLCRCLNWRIFLRWPIRSWSMLNNVTHLAHSSGFCGPNVRWNGNFLFSQIHFIHSKQGRIEHILILGNSNSILWHSYCSRQQPHPFSTCSCLPLHTKFSPLHHIDIEFDSYICLPFCVIHSHHLVITDLHWFIFFNEQSRWTLHSFRALPHKRGWSSSHNPLTKDLPTHSTEPAVVVAAPALLLPFLWWCWGGLIQLMPVLTYFFSSVHSLRIVVIV